MTTLGQNAMAMLEQAATYSEPGPGVTRVLGSPEHQSLLPVIEQWAKDAGADVSLDGAGNLVMRWAGKNRRAKTLIIGSHQDTVRQGGAYDGIMGVLLPLAVLQQLHQNGQQPPGPLELVAFSDEEGARFSSTLVGSSALAGTFDPAMLQATDQHGITLEQALIELGAKPNEIPGLARDPEKISGFFELHIEQGPVLESEGLPVGVVTAITSIERHRCRVIGKAGHAGTTPMHLRQDALLGASHVVQCVDKLCRETEDLVGVVGELTVTPGAVNVIPSAVELSIELRSPRSAVRQQAREKLMRQIEKQLEGMNLQWEQTLTYEQEEVTCADSVQSALAAAIERQGLPVKRLFSGAGHDGLAMASLTDIGMLFMRCKDGLSHHPDESVTEADLDATGRVIEDFILHWTY